MADQIEEIKQKTDIVALIAEYIPVSKAGRNYKANCPFHSEKTSSFMISPELQIFKCFGCGEGGDAFAFLQKYEGMDFGEAVKFLAERAGVKLIPFKGDTGGQKEKFYEINSFAARFYNYLLLNHPAGKVALEYLTKQRDIGIETIKTFGLGFGPEIPNALAKFLTLKKKFNIKDIEEAGLVVRGRGGYIDRFRGRVIFPLFDHRGNAVGLAGRILPVYEKKDLAKYINSPETPVYHKGNLLYGLNLTRGEIKRAEEVIVVEGEIDLISCWAKGIKNVVAIKGTALTEEQLTLLSRITKSIVLALDSDLAGDAASLRSINKAFDLGLSVRVVRLGKFKDPDEAARGNPEFLKKAISQAIGVWDFIIESTLSRLDPTSGEGKARASRTLLPILSQIPDKIVQAHYVELLAKKLKVPAESVAEQLSRVKVSENSQKPSLAFVPKKVEKTRRELLEERYLALVFRDNPSQFITKMSLKIIVSPFPARILEEYMAFSKKRKKFDVRAFATSLPEELKDGFGKIVLLDTRELPKDRLEKEVNIITKELEGLSLKEKLKKLSKEISELEEAGEQKNLKKLEGEFSKLSRKLTELEEKRFQGIIAQDISHA